MVQLLFGFNRDLATPNVVQNALRSILMTFDHVVYWCIGVVYNILFNISETTIISSDTLKAFYGRVQLILGVIMIFKISVSLLQYVINPEAFSDKKKGIGQVITRMVTMLAMLTAIVPLNIPLSAEDETNKTYNYYLNQNGLLFGTMFSLQHRILKQNTIAKLVLGNTENSFTVTDSDNTEYETDFSENSNAGEVVAAYVLKSFFRINVKDEINSDNINSQDNYYCGTSENVKDAINFDKVVESAVSTAAGATAGATVGSIIPGLGTAVVAVAGGVIGFVGDKLFNWATEDRASKYYKMWVSTTDVSTLAEMVNANCDDYYLFSYFPVVSTICGVLLLLVFATTCLDVAIRTLKLAILRLIAPIAIISYIDPKSAEKGAFSNWVKLLISTYLDLFLRLTIIYFVMFIVMEIIHGGLELPLGNGVIGLLSTVVIIIGLFYFARQAPKFITDALGIKSLGMGVGLSGLLGAAGALMGGAGLSGAAAGFMDASNQASDAAAQGKQAPSAYSTQRDKVAQMLTGKKDAKGGILGRATGAMQDRANSNMANRVFGLNREKVGQAKDLKYAMASGASDAKDTYDRFIKGSMNSAELNSILDSDRNNFGNMELDTFQDYLSSGGYGMSIDQNGQRLFTATDDQGNIRQLSQDESNNLIKDYLSGDAANKETLSAKQNAWYEEGAKMLEGMGINETLQEKYSARGRRRARIIGDSAKNLAANGRAQREYKVEHQNRGTGWN